MSWRLLCFSLLVFAGIATAFGLRMGDYLIEHVPSQANVPNTSLDDPAPMVDSEGRPVMHIPPQPLVDGKQGFPINNVAVDWKIQADSVDTTIKNDEDNQGNNVADDSPIITGEITVGSASGTLQTQPLTPIGRNRNAPSQGGNASWVGNFNAAMAQCRTQGFNERPACIQRTRQLYCSQNNAWGKVADCPAQ